MWYQPIAFQTRLGWFDNSCNRSCANKAAVNNKFPVENKELLRGREAAPDTTFLDAWCLYYCKVLFEAVTAMQNTELSDHGGYVHCDDCMARADIDCTMKSKNSYDTVCRIWIVYQWENVGLGDCNMAVIRHILENTILVVVSSSESQCREISSVTNPRSLGVNLKLSHKTCLRRSFSYDDLSDK